MPMLKLSMATWLIADPVAVQRKIAAACARNVPVVCGGGPFEIAAAAQQVLPEYLDLCATVGMTRIEAGEGFTDLVHDPATVLAVASARNLEAGVRARRASTTDVDAQEARNLVEKGRHWLGAGAAELVVEARESAADVGLFGSDGALDVRLAELFADAFGLATVIFEAPTKASQLRAPRPLRPRRLAHQRAP